MGLLDGGILGAAGGLADDLGKPAEATSADTYSSPYNVAKFDDFGADVIAGKNVEIARDRIPAGISRRWGFGRAKNERNQGFAWGQLRNAAGEPVTGQLSFEWENATGRQTEVATEVYSEDIDTPDRTDYESQVPMPEQRDKRKAHQDEYLIVTFTADEDETISAAESDLRFPATEYDNS